MSVPALTFILLTLLLQPTQQSTSKAPDPTHSLPDAPRPDPPGVYRVGNGVTAPKLLVMPNPEFSEKARKKKISGNCRLSLIVDVDGGVRDVKVVRSIAENQPPKLRAAAETLDQNAIEAVRQYRFKPGLRDGKPVPVAMEVEVNFQIF